MKLRGPFLSCLFCAAALLLVGCARFMASEGKEAGPYKAPVPVARSGRSAPTVVSGAVQVPGGEPQRAPRADQILKGTGVVVQEPPHGRSSATFDSSGDVILNFVDADVREVAKAVLGKILGVNYVIDPDVKGTLTIQTSRPLARAAVIPTLESVLPLTGATLVQAAGIYKIIPAKEAAKSGPAVRLGLAPGRPLPGYGVRVVPLKYVAAAEVQKMLGPIAPDGGILHVDTIRNVVILGGRQDELAAMMDTVEMFDIDWMAGMSFGLFPLENVDVATMVKELEGVFGDSQNGPLAGLVRLMPIERLNAVLAISAQPGYVDQVRGWVERLDSSQEGETQRLFIYFVQNGKAADLADVLTEAFGSHSGGGASRASLAPGLRPVELSSAAPPTTSRTATGTSVPTKPVSTPKRSSPAAPAVGRDLEIVPGNHMRIVADESRNALLISSTAREYRLIEAALKKLDLVPLQVLLEATIAEVTLTDELQYGLQWFFQSGNSKLTFSKLAGGAVAETFPGFSYFFTTANVAATLNALTKLTDVNVISSPQVLVVNNATATLSVGDQVPIATQSAVSSVDPDAPTVNSIQYRDTGVTLKVTPRVNASGLVTLEIDEETSEVVATTTSGIDSPTIQQRKISSTVVIRSGETVALGGLIKDTKDNTKTGIPGLASIPLFGALFRTTSDELRRTELLVLIVPRVVRDQGDARAVTEEMRRRLRGVRPLSEKIK